MWVDSTQKEYHHSKPKVINLFNSLFQTKPKIDVEGYLVVGLGNIGNQYFDTRHNIGFYIIDYIAKNQNLRFESERLGYRTTWNLKGKKIHLLKPTTYMNGSGRSVNYWKKKVKIPLENLLVLSDELQLEFGRMRLRIKGSSGGHNGLQNIEDYLGTRNYSRLRFGVGNKNPINNQAQYVLENWSQKEQAELDKLLPKSMELIQSFILEGPIKTMNRFN